MRYPLASIFFIITAFIFFAAFAVGSFLIDKIREALLPQVTSLGNSTLNDIWSTIPTAFGVIGVIFFIAGVVLIYFFDSTSDEPEYYWREE